MDAAPADADGAILIPPAELSAEALQAVIESFVLREGTDYGLREYSLQEKVLHVRNQLERGEAQILFESETGTVTIVPSARQSRSPKR